MASELSLLQSQLVQLRATINTLQASINETERAIVEGELALQTLHANTLAAERALSNPNLTTAEKISAQGIIETNRKAEAAQLQLINSTKIEYATLQGKMSELKRQYTSLEDQIREFGASPADPTEKTYTPPDIPDDPAGVIDDPEAVVTTPENPDYGSEFAADPTQVARINSMLSTPGQDDPLFMDNVNKQLTADETAGREAYESMGTVVDGSVTSEQRLKNSNIPNGGNPPVAGTPDATFNGNKKVDKRVRISLSPASPSILYKSEDSLSKPLKDTDGLIFPFTPAITLTHEARYDTISPTHSNFQFHYYQNSSINGITLQGDFVSRTQTEGRYVLAGINFLQSLTKMFTANDGAIAPGTPPIVARLHGYGISVFDSLPVVVTQVTVTYPDDVDYITIRSVTSKVDLIYKLPTVVTIAVQLLPLFSRKFASIDFSITGFNTGERRLMGK